MKKLNFKQRLALFVNKHSLLLVIALLSFGVIARLAPHAPNFAPIGAIALFGGLYLPRRVALFAPILAMLVSDYLIGFYSPLVMASTYVSFTIIGLLGLTVRRNKNFANVAGATMLGSVIFFLVTNAAVWKFGSFYPADISGLMASYINAIRFFRNTFLSDALYVGVLAGSYEFVTSWASRELSLGLNTFEPVKS
ncbi:hypothetical protein KC644_03585 [Candidatus Berkelbacteria bacterium]|nr:hypothetical protein [Candidatus Berkelbacteria bacterium]